MPSKIQMNFTRVAIKQANDHMLRRCHLRCLCDESLPVKTIEIQGENFMLVRVTEILPKFAPY